MTPIPGLRWRWPDGFTYRLDTSVIANGVAFEVAGRPETRVEYLPPHLAGSPDPTDPLTKLWLDAQVPAADEVRRVARITLDLGAPARAEGLDEERAVLAEAASRPSWVTAPELAGYLGEAIAVADQLAGEVARITAERDEARRVGARWVGTPCSDGSAEWRLQIGTTAHGRVGGSVVLVNADGQAAPSFDLRLRLTLPEASRAVCTRLGLPLITEGLEVDRG